jgi:predicted dithiol-disulfide oxidoreductase (DUF899 family)
MVRHSVRFPDESAAYRAARDKLLEAEGELRLKLEEVAALRRALPAGGAVPQDYSFTASGGRTVRLSELFGRPGASLVLYSFMFGPDAASPCPMCTSMLDGLDGSAKHALQRINLGVVAKAPIERIEAFARARGWRNLPLLSSAGTGYNGDYHGETAEGAQIPLLNVFTREGGVTRHRWASELLFAPPEPGMNHRHVDLIWPLWHLLDATPEGRGNDWYPKLAY